MRFLPRLRFFAQQLLQSPFLLAILFRGLWRLIRLGFLLFGNTYHSNSGNKNSQTRHYISTTTQPTLYSHIYLQTCFTILTSVVQVLHCWWLFLAVCGIGTQLLDSYQWNIFWVSKKEYLVSDFECKRLLNDNKLFKIASLLLLSQHPFANAN